MPRCKNDKDEEIRKEKIRKKTMERLKPHYRVSEDKILRALINGPLSYNRLQEKSELSRNAFNNSLHRLLRMRKVCKTGSKKRDAYALTGIPNDISLELLSTSFLHHSLENSSISQFNQYLGSLITYVLRHYQRSKAMLILSHIISQIEAYVNLPVTFMEEPLSVSKPNVESAKWELWKDIDSKNYVTGTKIDKNGVIIEKAAINYVKFKEKWLKTDR